jgi:predicted dehydrogenase
LAELVATADPVVTADFADYRAMLAKVKPEAVVIATPNALHVPMGLACAEAGIAMLVEKPIADTVEAANRLVEAADRAGVALLVGHHRRHNPIVEKAREIVQGGQLGRLNTVAALFLLQKPADYFDVAWRRDAGGGPLLINLIHDVDNLRFICGEITEVQAMTSSAERGFDVEDSAVVTLRFAGGALGTATVSDAVAAPWSWEVTSGENPMYPRQQENCYLFCGTEASLALPALELWSYEGKRGWHAPLSRERLEVAHEDPLVRQLRHFCRVVRGEEKSRISGADATRTLAATLAIHEAAASRRPVTLAA